MPFLRHSADVKESNRSNVRKLCMELEEPCQWFLIRVAEDCFAVQYSGPEPDTFFPASISGPSRFFFFVLTWIDETMLVIMGLLRNRFEDPINLESKRLAAPSSSGTYRHHQTEYLSISLIPALQRSTH